MSTDQHSPPEGSHHDHNHAPGTGVLARVRHAVSEVFGAHSHDVVDQVDEALEADTDGRRALLLSLGILAATAIIQAVVVVVSGSVALLGDTLHNVADAGPADEAGEHCVGIPPRDDVEPESILAQ